VAVFLSCCGIGLSVALLDGVVQFIEELWLDGGHLQSGCPKGICTALVDDA
jgi:hypothetical protein